MTGPDTYRQWAGAVRRGKGTSFHGESHSPVVHKLWVLVVAGSNPASPTKSVSGPRKTARTRGTKDPFPTSCPATAVRLLPELPHRRLEIVSGRVGVALGHL